MERGQDHGRRCGFPFHRVPLGDSSCINERKAWGTTAAAYFVLLVFYSATARGTTAAAYSVPVMLYGATA